MKQLELPSKTMIEADLPGMPKKPKRVEPEISNIVMKVIGDAAAVCAADPKILKAFFEQLAEQYPGDGQPISLLIIRQSGKRGINITLTPLPTLSSVKDRALIHTLGLRCVEGLTIKNGGSH